MSMLQVRNLSEATHQALRVRAEQAGQSLSEYVADRLDEIVATPTLDEVFARIDAQGSRLADSGAAALLRQARDPR